MNYDILDEIFTSMPFFFSFKDIKVLRFHKYDLQKHTQKVVEYLKSENASLDLVASGYLHDIGKVVLATPYGDGYYSIGKNHESIGATIIENMKSCFFADLSLDKSLIVEFVKRHDEPVDVIRSIRKLSDESYLEGLNKYISSLQKEGSLGRDLMQLYWADSRAKGASPDIGELEGLYMLFHNNISSENILKRRITKEL